MLCVINYWLKKITLANIIKMKLLKSIRIYLVVVSKVVRYKKLIKKQNVKKPKLVKVNKVKK